jgi:hypothetical protein
LEISLRVLQFLLQRLIGRQSSRSADDPAAAAGASPRFSTVLERRVELLAELLILGELQGELECG